MKDVRNMKDVKNERRVRLSGREAEVRLSCLASNEKKVGAIVQFAFCKYKVLRIDLQEGIAYLEWIDPKSCRAES